MLWYDGNAFSSLIHVHSELQPVQDYRGHSRRKIGRDRPEPARRFRRGHAGKKRDTCGPPPRPQSARDESCVDPAASYVEGRPIHPQPERHASDATGRTVALPIREALDSLQRSLEPTQFNPSTAKRHFRIAADNYAAIVLVGPLAARIAKTAPAVTLEFRPSGTLDIVDLLDRGELELAIGSFPEQGERFSRQPLLQDEFVAVLRRNHPATNARELSIEIFAALPHLEISSVHHATDFIDEALARRKLSRRIALRAPFLSAVRILAASDMVSVFPQRVARELIRYRPLAIRPLAHLSPVIETAMVWPRQLDNQPAHRWLRENIGSVAKTLRSE